jgi:hypothetical protein
MKIRLLASIIFVVIIAALISACGDSGQTTTEASTQAGPSDIPDPCALFTKADAAGILGEPVQEPNRSLDATGKSCAYMTGGTPTRTISVSITKPCSMADYSNYAEDPNAQAVAGIGMHASWNKTVLLVHSVSGDTCIFATGGENPAGTDPTDDKPAMERAKKVATGVLGKLEPGSASNM